jgi:hypothetical protein
MGPYYYFTNFEKSIHSCCEINETYKFGIIRFALFLGNMKVPQNLENDEPDCSEKTKSILLLDHTASSEKYKRERELLRVSDRDGLWAQYYDSVYIGNFSLDNGEKNEDCPYWIVKNYEQQTVLSFHLVNKSCLKNGVYEIY